ncbi:MAG: ATP-binding cassette domain-containing protein [Planctomycetes bacterium]|nr:ATP-binding cassette domain-containing protein [Planctomycetota bacterium]
MSTIIKVENLSRVYRKGDNEIVALDRVSLEVKEGEFVSIMGPSGSGKSTLMHILGGLDRPTSGAYLLDGERVDHLNDTELSRIRGRKVGFVFQTFNLLPDSTAGENVALPLLYLGLDAKVRRKWSAKAVGALGLADRIDHRPTELSGGQVQRVAIARALVNRPRLILADEPTGNLDSHTGQEIMAIFQKLHEAGNTVVMVTHDERLARYASRIIELRDGKTVSEREVTDRTMPDVDAEGVTEIDADEDTGELEPRRMRWVDMVRIGCREGLMAHKMRTALTMLGVLFGVSAVIAMSSIGEGGKQQAIQQIEQMGINNIRVRALDLKGEELMEARRKLSAGLTRDDARALRELIPSIEYAVPMKAMNIPLTYEAKKPKAKVIATAPEYQEVVNFHVSSGRFINGEDMAGCRRVCVLGVGIKWDLFANDVALDRLIRIGREWHVVVGVMEEKARPEGSAKAISERDLNHDVYIPLTAALKRTKLDPLKSEITEIAVKVKSADLVRKTAGVIETVMDRRHRNVDDYKIVIPQELLEQHQRTQRIFNTVIGFTAMISLVVGGIGIMNIMLATVTERTKEIGIRRSVGACKRDILRQFLIEAVGISLTGGAFGIALGCLFAGAIPMLAGWLSPGSDWPTVVSAKAIVLGFTLSVSVGVLFGIYPAYKAAAQDPIEALRYE